MLSDLSYIPFNRSWAEGFRQLLKKLQSLDAPRPLADGKAAVSAWFADRDAVAEVPERVWTNLLPLHEIPSDLLRVTLASPPPSALLAAWPHRRESDMVYWALEGPGDSGSLDVIDIEQVSWEEPYDRSRIRLADVTTHLISEHLHAHCERKGMARTPDGKHLYFPPGLLPGDWASFVGYNGRRTRVRVVGERTFRVGATQRERCRYHLSPTFRPTLWKYDRPVIQIQTRVFLTDTSGRPLESRKASRRRRAIGKNWWNYQWLSRLLAVASWISDEAESVNLARSPGCRLIVGGMPISLGSPVGINEAALGPEEEEDEEAELTEEDVLDADEGPESGVDG